MLACATELLMLRTCLTNVPNRNKTCNSKSVFTGVKVVVPAEVFELTKQFQKDKDPKKVNMGVGAYRTDDNKPYVFPVVKKCEIEIVNDPTMNHEYLPMAGNADFVKASTELILGDSQVLKEKKVVAVQTVSGTNGCRVAAEVMARLLKKRTVYLPNPTWENHEKIFRAAGFKQIEEYPYWNEKKLNIDISRLLAGLCKAPEGAVILLHCSAHNPTGMDPTHKQWKQIAAVIKSNNLFPFFDSAYQGFATGDPDRDAWPVRYFVNQGFETLIAQSYSKNMGLYNERVGNLVVTLNDKELAPAVLANLTMFIRVNYSNPPAFGSRIVAKVLNDKKNREEWLKTIKEMAERVKLMRNQLVCKLQDLGTPGKWDHINKQVGMFSYTGLTEDQVEKLIKNYHIYLLKSGRINLCALNTKNIDYVAQSISEVVKGASGGGKKKIVRNRKRVKMTPRRKGMPNVKNKPRAKAQKEIK